MEVYSTKLYDKWFARLKDKVAKVKIESRIRRILTNSDYGDCEKISNNVTELKIDYGPGYRIYLTTRAQKILILLAGGNKSTQVRDIKKAKKIALKIKIERVSEWG